MKVGDVEYHDKYPHIIDPNFSFQEVAKLELGRSFLAIYYKGEEIYNNEWMKYEDVDKFCKQYLRNKKLNQLLNDKDI